MHMTFLFEQPQEYNLHLVREFYSTWDPGEWDLEIKVHGEVLTFTAHDINVLLGTTDVDAEPLKQINIIPPYDDIR